MKLLLKISYLGTAYCGYQVQANGDTVQQKLNEAAQKVFGCPCDIVGCSRTDSGVHANEFCLTVSEKGKNRLSFTIPTEKIPKVMNMHLPDDIAVFEAQMVDEDFHPRYHVSYKEYVYRIWNGKTRNPFLSDRAYFPPYTISEDAIARMNQAAQCFIGKKDFAAYMAAGSKIQDTVRQVFYAEVKSCGDMITYRVAADGFLYNMVRIMVGTLIEVARGSISPEDVENIIASKDRRLAGATAPACGLYLNRVSYEPYKAD